MFVTKDLMGLYYRTTECLVMLVVFYLIILVPVSVLGSVAERRLRYGSFGN
jgi:polar amino acid transport system permease protein